MTQPIRVTFTLDQREIDALTQPDGMIGRAVANAAEVTVRRAQANVDRYGRVRTGAMRRSIQAGELRGTPSTVSVQVGATESYSIYQHEGTSRGITPAPFLTDALRELRPDDFRAD